MRLPVLAALAALALASGCASDHRKADEELMRQSQRGAFQTRAAATGLAAALSVEADALAEARKAKQEAGAEAAALRVKDGLLILEALEESELTFDYAARFWDLHDSLEVPPKVLAHLESDVGHMLEIATLEHARTLDFLKARAGYDVAASERLRRDLERDRNALKAYRTDMGLSTRITSRTP